MSVAEVICAVAVPILMVPAAVGLVTVVFIIAVVRAGGGDE